MRIDYIDRYESCSINLPYPNIEIKEKNINYAKIIKKCYCGLNSELTLVNKYFYEKFLYNSYLKDIFSKILKVELEHLNILAEVLVALGDNPSFYIQKKDRLYDNNIKFPDKDITLKNLLLDNIKNEKILIKEYRNICKTIEDENIITILNRIILDEELHIKILREIYKNEIDK